MNLPESVTSLLRFLVPDADTCRAMAAQLRQDHPGKSDLELARQAVADARRWAAAAGTATGIFASPVVMIPAALADMAAVLRIEGTMAGTVAALLDPHSLTDPAVFEADVLAVVFPGAVSQALRQIGLRAAQQVTRNLVRKSFTESLLKTAGEFAAKRLLLRVSEKALAAKTVPLIGAGIGAGWNWVELHAVGQRAIGYYQGKSLSPAAARRRSYSVRTLVNLLPWKKRDEGQRGEAGEAGEAGDDKATG